MVPDVNRDNNTEVSADTIAVTVTAVPFASSVSGTIQSGQQVYYALTLAAGQDALLTGNAGAMNAAEMYVRSSGIADHIGLR